MKHPNKVIAIYPIKFLQHIKQHQYFYKIALNIKKTFPLKQGQEEMWRLITLQCNEADIVDHDEIMYYFINFQAGITMILKHWVDTNCILDEENVAIIIKNCVPKPTK